ncbi:hypothetical protein ACFC26_28155 [Kitasatospora purpeofusca]|uniref:hypothetical protein n=1 Tax=Kitasatospora purpeofusca TaxID=67352 RepID=UPI0035E28689
MKAAKTRFEMRAGMALEMIRSEPILFTQKGYSDFKSYVKGRWGYSLSRAYQLMDIVLVMTAVSTIVETALPESQVRDQLNYTPAARGTDPAAADDRTKIVDSAALQHSPDLGDAVLAGYEKSGEVRRRLRRHIDAATT